MYCRFAVHPPLHKSQHNNVRYIQNDGPGKICNPQKFCPCVEKSFQPAFVVFVSDVVPFCNLPTRFLAKEKWVANRALKIIQSWCYKKVFTAAELRNIFWNQTWTSIRFLQSTFCSKCFFQSKIHHKQHNLHFVVIFSFAMNPHFVAIECLFCSNNAVHDEIR